MANTLKGETPLTLADGREFTLLCDMEALVGVEALTGKPLPMVIRQAGEGFWSATAAIAQAAFARFHPEIAREDVLAMLRTDRAALEEALTEALKHAFGDPDSDAGDAEGNAPKRPRGKSSGRNGAKQGSTPKRSGGRRRAASA